MNLKDFTPQKESKIKKLALSNTKASFSLEGVTITLTNLKKLESFFNPK